MRRRRPAECGSGPVRSHVTLGQVIEWLYDPVALPGRDTNEQALWAALILTQLRGPIGGVA